MGLLNVGLKKGDRFLYQPNLQPSETATNQKVNKNLIIQLIFCSKKHIKKVLKKYEFYRLLSARINFILVSKQLSRLLVQVLLMFTLSN
jgi:hypothetical protein